MNAATPAINRMQAVMRSPYAPGMRTTVRAYTPGAAPATATWCVLVIVQVDLTSEGATVQASENDDWSTVYTHRLTGFWSHDRALDAYQAAVADLLESGQQLIERREWVAEHPAARAKPEPGPTMVRTGSNGDLTPMEPGQLVTDIDNRLWLIMEAPENTAEHIAERDGRGRRLMLLPLDPQSMTPTGACQSPTDAQTEAAGPGRTVGLWLDSHASDEMCQRVRELFTTA